MPISKLPAYIYLIFIIAVIIHILKKQKSPNEKLFWLFTVLFIPGIGALIYIYYTQKPL